MSFEHLFAPGSIGAVQLDNRIVLSPMSTLFAEEDGTVGDTIVNWYARRARGGAGLVVVEAAQVGTTIDALRMWANVLSADSDRFLPGLTAVAKAVHANGAKIGIQLSPGAGAQAAGSPWSGARTGTVEAVSPSGIPALHSDRRPRALTMSEIEKIIEDCGESALRVKNAGFDLINLHGHGGYLLAQFLSPYFNRRIDRYGGTAENRFRFLLDILRQMRTRVGPGFPITVKYSIDEYIDGGRGLEESRLLATRLEEAGADAIFIAVGAHGSRAPIVPPHFVPAGSHLPLAEAIKATVRMPVVVGGRLNAAHFAEQVLKDGKADFIALGRALIADPDWPIKVRSGAIGQIRPCLACNVCRQRLFTSEPVRCAINAVAGREKQLDSIETAKIRKTVLVVGGGPAGLETARIAAARGHRVILCEKGRRLGGMLQLAGVFNKEITPFLGWLEAQARKLGVDVRLRTTVSPALIRTLRPDAIVVASGSRFLPLPVAGARQRHVLGGSDLLQIAEGRSSPKHGLLFKLAAHLAAYFYSPDLVAMVMRTNLVIKRTVVIIGGQLSGCKLAFHLARLGKDVTVVEESDTYGAEMEETTLDLFNYQIEDGKVRMLANTKVQEITAEGVLLVSKDGLSWVQPAGTVMIALGLDKDVSCAPREFDGLAKEVAVVGDAKGFLGIPDAISDGYVTGLRL
jgi:2,4-dienoyl-CoA reductase-like NADH-dependent reductase (Old Yellow Enzyme family)